MIPAPISILAEAAFRLPEALHHRGPPSAWARMTRPGQPMHSFLEAAVFDGEGNLWLSDVPCGRVFRISPGGDWSVVHEYSGAPHAMAIAPGDRHLAVDYHHGLIELTGTDSYTVLSTGLPGQPFLGLSDMCFSDDGTLWFTDSGRSSLSAPVGRVYRRDAGGKLRLVLDCMPYSNGICLSADGKWVYVAATRANQVWRFSADVPDSGPPMVGTFLQLSGGLGPDGLAANALGWLAVAQAQAGRAYVFSALGDPLAVVHLPEGLWTTSVAFHPENPRLLYVVDAQFGAVFSANLEKAGK
ncbi:SMP-30/gluconolactonase/LRE family protein [Oceanibium sediminis]|uniref:SMP-30/gluconolactonase/LRE family protein n=1 Tax=Oceanibium sediminis TaxID=2026339 RepID=UPI000DD377B9|nr:SMP-30/gluconolactonase/LRE family protein [Oceanibium sediminis]